MSQPSGGHPLGPGSVVATRYELIESIATGGMGRVWRAHDVELNRQVAIKVMFEHLRSDPESVRRFRREAQASAQLVHPHIVAVYDTISTDAIDAIVMELVEGMTLRDHLDLNGPVGATELRRIGTELASALQCAHSHGVVHRDVKPANILLTNAGVTKLVDFGIAKAHEDPDLTVVGTLVGTAAYLAPEQVGSGAIDQRSDLYALSTVLYEAACGTTPFRGDSATATALARLHEAPAPLETRVALPSTLCDTIMRNLELAPERRYQSAHDFGLALRDASATEAMMPPSSASTEAAKQAVVPAGAAVRPFTTGAADADTTPPRRPGRRRRTFARLLIMLFIVIPLGITAALLLREPSAAPVKARPAPAVSLVDAPVDGAVAFDPNGSGTPGENNALAARAVDGNPKTAWPTESYDDQHFGTKPGVGLVVNLVGTHRIDHLELTSSVGWSGRIFLGDSDLSKRGELPSGGTPIATDGAVTSVSLNGESASSVLIWITDLGPATGRHHVDIFEAKFVARETVGG